MTLVVGNQFGRVHHAAGNHCLQETRPTYAFVPMEHFTAKGFQKDRYLASPWPEINCGANRHSVGSHVLPDPQKPVTSRSKCPVLTEFLTRLETLASVKASRPDT